MHLNRELALKSTTGVMVHSYNKLRFFPTPEATQLLAESSAVIPQSLAPSHTRTSDRFVSWFYENSERIILELFVHPTNNRICSCDAHGIAFNTPCEIGIVPSSIQGNTTFSLPVREANNCVTSALESLLCHSVSHTQAVLLDGFLLRSALLAYHGRDAYAFLCMWTLLLVRCSPHADSRTEFLEDLTQFPLCTRWSFGSASWCRTLKTLTKLRNNWKRCHEHSSPYQRVVSLEDKEHRCECGSGLVDAGAVELLGPSSKTYLAKCKRQEGYCGYLAVSFSYPIAGESQAAEEGVRIPHPQRERKRHRTSTNYSFSVEGPDGQVLYRGTPSFEAALCKK
jgi:hypothetical protein